MDNVLLPDVRIRIVEATKDAKGADMDYTVMQSILEPPEVDLGVALWALMLDARCDLMPPREGVVPFVFKQAGERFGAWWAR